LPNKGSAANRVFLHPDCLLHLAGTDHPERPGRLTAIQSALADRLAGNGGFTVPRPATLDEILSCHSREYVDLVRKEIRNGARALSTGDTLLSPGSLAAALAAAGTVTTAVDAVLTGATRTAFCAVRPPGHHASRDKGMGFCIFNNVALGARHAQRKYGITRVLIVDWDVHHGNGTQDIFWSDGSVLFFDTHLENWYPHTGAASEQGEGKALGLIINRPFARGAGRAEILGAFRDTLLPAAERFRPELVMISAGFDSRSGDPLGGFALSDRDFADLTDLARGIADRHAGGRLISVLEGGYNFEGLASAVVAHVGRLAAER
jgi:acetoin utilization deacetylase AcuC-like enzyme